MSDRDSIAPGGVKMRLPRMGCFPIFGLFFIVSTLMAMAFCRTALNAPPVFAAPTERVTVADPGKVLLEPEAAEIEKLAADIAAAGECSVCCLFVDERNADLCDLRDQLLSEWRPGKGVLLLCGTRGNSLQLRLAGPKWRLAGWNAARAAEELRRIGARHRGRSAIALLKRLRQAVAQAAHPAARVTEKPEPPVLFSRGGHRSEIRYPWLLAAVTAALAVLIGYVGLKNGGKYRAASLKSNPEVAAEFRRRSGSEPELKLVDLNEESAKWTHAAALKIAAMVFGVLVGVLCAFSAFAGPVSKDPAYAAPAATGNSVRVGRIDDRAGVFGEDERRQLAALIAKVERSTGGEIGILTVKTLGGQSLEEFSLNAATRWKLGKAGKDNGAMLLLAIRECRNRLEIGYGWEGRINDAKAGDMLRSIVPELRAGKYAAGAAKVVSAIERAVLDLPDPAEFSRLVDDRAMVFTEKERRGIFRGLAKVAQATGGGRVGIVTVRSTGGQPMREFAIRNAPAGTLGRSADRGGAVLLLAVDDKAVHLEISPRWAQAVDRRYAEALLRVVNKDFAAGKYALGAVKTALVIRDKVLKAGAAANIPTVTAFADIPVKAPVRDPRVADDSGTWAGLFGIFGVLAGFVLGYWGRLVATSVPRMYIYDPTMVRDSSSSSDSDYGSGSSGSSSSSGSSDSGGGGSFGGGGASGGW